MSRPQEPQGPLLVVALGGNALLRRGEPQDAAHQLANVRKAARQLALLARDWRLVIAHGNGPQVGLLALQNEALGGQAAFPLDVLGAQTEGQIGYLLEQELANRLGAGRSVATLLTRVQVDAADPAFDAPTKPIGPVYDAEQAQALGGQRGWQFVKDGAGLRRAVPSPRPLRITNLGSVQALLERGTVVICAGGGGIPVADAGQGRLEGVEAVIDKDRAASLLARQLQADLLLIATDVSAVYLNWGTRAQRAIAAASPAALRSLTFEAGSIGPKVEAACDFAEATRHPAVIGALEEIDRLALRAAGTRISTAVEGLHFQQRRLADAPAETVHT